MKSLAVLAVFVLSFGAIAHEGAHGPAQKVAPHGGVLRDGATLMFELVRSPSGIKIFALQHDGKPLDPKEVVVDLAATTLKDSKGKSVEYKLQPEADSFTLTFGKSNSHRYALSLSAKYKGKVNMGVWQIEMDSE